MGLEWEIEMKSACVGAHIPIDNSLKYLALGARALDVGCFQFFVGMLVVLVDGVWV